MGKRRRLVATMQRERLGPERVVTLERRQAPVQLEHVLPAAGEQRVVEREQSLDHEIGAVDAEQPPAFELAVGAVAADRADVGDEPRHRSERDVLKRLIAPRIPAEPLTTGEQL